MAFASERAHCIRTSNRASSSPATRASAALCPGTVPMIFAILRRAATSTEASSMRSVRRPSTLPADWKSAECARSECSLRPSSRQTWVATSGSETSHPVRASWTVAGVGGSQRAQSRSMMTSGTINPVPPPSTPADGDRKTCEARRVGARMTSERVVRSRSVSTLS